MTPKEKAVELLMKMLSKNPNRQDGISMIDTIQAKLCALVAVDEIIRVLQDEQDWYWTEVKEEIEKL
jgi:hypothetical protein